MVGIYPELEEVIVSLNILINLVPVSGKPNIDVPIGTLKSIWRQAQLEDE